MLAPQDPWKLLLLCPPSTHHQPEYLLVYLKLYSVHFPYLHSSAGWILRQKCCLKVKVRPLRQLGEWLVWESLSKRSTGGCCLLDET